MLVKSIAYTLSEVLNADSSAEWQNTLPAQQRLRTSTFFVSTLTAPFPLIASAFRVYDTLIIVLFVI